MISFLQHLFDTSGFPPRWHCGQWSDGHGWLHILSDIAIFGAYAAIPLTLAYFIRRRKDLPFLPIFWLFAVFIVACGLSHLIEATIFWHPWYRLSGLVKLVTAVVSWMTVFALLKVLPSALALPGIAKINQQLSAEIAERKRAEEALREKEHFLQRVITISPSVVYIMDLADLRITWVNAQVATVMGYSVAEVLELGPAFMPRAMHPDDLLRMPAHFEQLARSRDGELVEIEYRLRHPDGTWRWFGGRKTPFSRDAKGNVREIIGTSSDITERKRAEEAMARLAAIVESSQDAIVGKDLCGTITSWNQGAATLFGYSAEEIVGQSILRVIPPERRDEEADILARVARGEGLRHSETVRRRKDGSLVEVSITVSPIKDAAGTIVGISKVARDITERKRVEESLWQNAALFLTLIAQAPIGTYVVDAQLRLTQVNAQAMPAFGSVQPLIGRDFDEVVKILWGPELGGQVADVFRHTLETGERYISPPFTELRHDLGIKETYEWETQRVTLPDGQHGVVCYFHEVTERQRSIEALRASQERMRLAAEATGVGIWEWNVISNLIRWDTQMFRVYDVPPTEGGIVPYETWSNAVLPEDLPEQERVLQDTLRRQGQSTREFRITRANDGQVRIIKAIETVRANLEGKTEWVVGSNLDVTERRQAAQRLSEAKEAAESANRSKDRFLAILSHELRTPLTPVLMTVAALEHDPSLRTDVRDDMTMIRRSIEIETKLIDDLLDVSRIASGKLELRIEPLDLNGAVQHVCSICRPQVLGQEVQLTLDLCNDAGFIHADPARFEQVLWNVLKNAVKFTPRKGAIHITSQRLSPTRVEVRITDNGPGIPPEVLPRIFDAFEQGDPRVTKQFGGLGLGLAISKALIELHGGSICAESQGTGHGATFIIEVPGILMEIPATEKPTSSPPRDTPSLRLLVVEDHADTARALKTLLTLEGFIVTTAGDVASALVLAGSETFDLLISDLGLPDANGYELMAQMQDIQPLSGIAMSGFGMEEDVRQSLAAGFSEHLVKPIKIPQLLTAIGRLSASSREKRP